MRSLAPEHRKNFLILFCTGLSFWISLSALMPTLPTYIEDLGGSKPQVGLVMGSFAIGLLACRPLCGRLADQHSRKLVVMIGLMAVAVAPLGYLFVQSIPLLMVIRGFHGISHAAFAIGYSTLIVDLAPPDRRGELIGYMSLVVPIGTTIGPAAGGLLQAGAGYIPLFLMSASLGVVGLLFACGVQEAQRVQEAGSPSVSLPATNQWNQIATSPRLQAPAIVLLLFGLALGIMLAFLPLYIRDLQVDFNPGLFYSLAAISTLLVRITIGRASDRSGRGVFITLSLSAFALAMLLLATAQQAGSLILAAIAQGAGGGTLVPLMFALMADRSTINERARVNALCLLGFDLGLALAGPLFGVVAAWVGDRGLFFLATALTLLAIAVFMTRSSIDLAHSWRFATGRGTDLYAIPAKPSASESEHRQTSG